MLEEVAFRVALSNQASLFCSLQVPAIYLLKWKFPIFQVASSFQFTYFFLYAHNHALFQSLTSDSVQRINHSKLNNILTLHYFLPLLYCYQKYYVALLDGFYQEFTSLYGYFTNLIVDKSKPWNLQVNMRKKKKFFCLFVWKVIEFC